MSSYALLAMLARKKERLAFLDRVFEMGCTFWDTAGGFFSLNDLGRMECFVADRQTQ